METKDKMGFTLIELLVVIAIIGVLAAIGVTSFSGAQGKARDAKRQEDLHNLTNYLLGTYLITYDAFPVADPTIAAGLDRGPVWFGDTGTNLRVESDSKGFALAKSPNQGASGGANDYWYATDTTGKIFAMWTKMESAPGEWFVINSKGYAGLVPGSGVVTTVPAAGSPSNTECVDSYGGTAVFSPCLAMPEIH